MRRLQSKKTHGILKVFFQCRPSKRIFISNPAKKAAANENVFVNLGENLADNVFVNDFHCLTSSFFREVEITAS